MLTMKIYEGQDGTFKNPDDAITYMYKTNFKRDVSIYDISSETAYKKALKIYKAIKQYNKGKELNKQILPTSPFEYRGILGCLGVQVYGMSFITYEKSRECFPLFMVYNESVLDTSRISELIPP